MCKSITASSTGDWPCVGINTIYSPTVTARKEEEENKKKTLDGVHPAERVAVHLMRRKKMHLKRREGKRTSVVVVVEHVGLCE